MDNVMSEIKMRETKRIVLVAHDNMKKELLEWALFNKNILSKHELFATGSTGKILIKALEMPVNCFKSGPLGGDQQIGAKIAEGGIDMAVFSGTLLNRSLMMSMSRHFSESQPFTTFRLPATGQLPTSLFHHIL